MENLMIDNLNELKKGSNNPINPNLSTESQNFFCEHYTDFCKMLDIINEASTNKLVHIIVVIAEAIVKGVAAGICEERN
jgi:hypothetical protein